MDLPGLRPRRVSIVGSTGTGKTTMGRELAAILGVPHVELDALAWGPNWTIVDDDTFLSRVREALAANGWVVDGNYGGRGARQMAWASADTVVWLDLSLPVIFRRLLQRTTARIKDGRELWPGTGNRETIRNAFFSRESLFVWAAKTYWRRKRNYSALFELPEHAHLTKLRFRSPAQADRWLKAERERAAGGIETA
jgi:adenylate kinase family enzyme